MEWDVYNHFLNHDIICPQETWCEDSEAHILEDENVKAFYSNRKIRHRNAKRPSGGVALSIKRYIDKGIKPVFSSSDDAIWVKLHRKYFNLDKDIYLCIAYLPPKGSIFFSWYNIGLEAIEII